MKEISDYVAYLPPVLWSRESDPDQRLGRMLRIFERLLTADDSQVPLTLNGRAYRPLEQTIDELYRLFDPWRAPAEFLPWLASWLPVEVPPTWSEHQRRRLMAEAMVISMHSGLKEGLARLLEVYADTPWRPRIAIDDGEVVFRGRFLEDGTMRLTPIAFSTVLQEKPEKAPALIYPVAVAVDKYNHYLVADQGTPPKFETFVPAIWQLSSTGELSYPRSPNGCPLLKPLYAGNLLRRPVALAVDGQNCCYVLDADYASSGKAAISRLDPAGDAYKLTPVTPEAAWAVYPVDMVIDAKKRFIVLDRGVQPEGEIPTSEENKAKLIIVTSKSEKPVEIPLRGVIEPTALCRWGKCGVIVADARDQSKEWKKEEPAEPATLVLVDLDSGDITTLLAALPPNPLIFPTGLAVDSSRRLIVCDSGVRWGIGNDFDPGQRVVAKPAALYRIENLGDPKKLTISRITDQRQLVTPKKIAIDYDDQLVIVDAGEALHRNPSCNWRADQHTIGIVVLFSCEHPTLPEKRKQVLGDIEALVTALQPAQVRVRIDNYNTTES